MLLFFAILSIFFIIIISIILITVLILVFSEIKLKVDKLQILGSFYNPKYEYKIKLQLYFVGKVKLLSIRLDNNKSEKILSKTIIKKKIEKLKKHKGNQKEIEKDIIKRFIKLKRNIQIEQLKLQINIDTENVFLTTYLVGIISALIPNAIRGNIRNYNKRDYNFEVLPLYKNKNYIYLQLSSIISIKLVHIINMFKVIGGKKNERSSNRRFNVNCYGKY